jgi:hypothetical protein
MACAGELNRLADSTSPNVQTRSISDTFARRTRAKSSSASATARARLRSVAVSSAILRARLSSCFANAGLVPMPTLRRWRYALRLARSLPDQDRGPPLWPSLKPVYFRLRGSSDLGQDRGR